MRLRIGVCVRPMFLAGAVISIFALATAHSQLLAQAPYPNKPVRLVVPYAPGGVTDLMGRLLAERLSRILGQQMIVENRPGASGNIGAQQVATSQPDGYTLLLGFDGTLVINPNVLGNAPFDAVRDFAPIGRIGDSVSILIAYPGINVKTLRDVIALSKSQTGGLSYGTSGTGGSMHLAGELLKQQSGAGLIHVPFKGSAPATLAALSGHIPLALVAIGGAQQYIHSGKLIAIAVPSAKRSRNLPDVPTFIESGVADFNVASWFGILAPARTPKSIVDKLNAELNSALSDAEIRERLNLMDVGATPGTAEVFGEEIRRDLVRYGAIVKAAGIKAN